MATQQMFRCAICIAMTASTLLSFQPPRLSFAGAPAAKSQAQTPATRAVAQFLRARNVGDEVGMYGLWSLDSRRQVRYTAFVNGEILKDVDSTTPPMSEPMKAVAILFLDIHNGRNYTFAMAGADPDDPTVVNVDATPAGATAPLRLKVITVKDSDNRVRLDLMKTATAAEPGIVKKVYRAEDAECARHLKELALGVVRYAQDHDRRLPDADKWADEILPYVHDEQLFHDPQDAEDHKWSYAFNRELSGKRLSAFGSPATTVLLFDSTSGERNASDTGQSLPHPGRHGAHIMFAFVDGHITAADDGHTPKINL